MKIKGLLSLFQAAPTVEMADLMRSEGKIYVVVAGILLVCLGMFGYLLFLHREMRRISQKKNTAEIEEEEERQAKRESGSY